MITSTTRILLALLPLAWGLPAAGQQPRTPTGPGALGLNADGEPLRAVLSGPSGDTIAILGPHSRPVVLDEQGDWVRVRVEGWTQRSDLAAASGASNPAPLTLSDLRANPDAHAGSAVRWTVQNLGLQRADSLRRDMTPGQAYLLARDPGGETGMVYIMVPERLLPSVATIGPLDRFELVGRIITGRSALTGHPILEMLEMP